jgi:Protein of unknown function (DUF3822)
LQTTSLGYKLIKKVKDEKFDEEHLHQYSLLVQLGVRDLQMGVLSEDNRLLLFEDYVFSEIESPEEQFQVTKELYESHPLLLAGFWKNVTFSIKNNKSAQIPASLFIEESSLEYLRFNAQIDTKKEVILNCRNLQIDAITVFALSQGLYDWLRSVYTNTNIKFIHQSAALIEGVLDAAPQHKGNSPLFLYVDRFKLHILSANGGKLVYYNQFPIKHFADYMKYIMLVITALGLNQETSQVVLWGYIGKNSPHYHEFVKYVRNVTFGSRPKHISFGYMFDEVQEHHFFDLFSTRLLV